MPVLDPAAPGSFAGQPPPPLEAIEAFSQGFAAAEAAGSVRAVAGELIVIDRFGRAAVLAQGDPVASGDVLIGRGDGRAVVGFAGGASLAMTGEARAEIRAADAGEAHVVIHAGSFVAAAAQGGGGGPGALTIESGAAIVVLEVGALSLRYGLEAGLRIAPVAADAPAEARIVNDSGVHELDPAAGLAVAHWSAPPELLSAGADAPAWLMMDGRPSEDGAGEAAAASEAGGAAETGDAADGDPHAEGAEADGGPALATGAGTAEDGDPTFVFPPPASRPQGLADTAPALAPLPALPSEPFYPATPARPADFEIDGHAIDPLVLWQRQAEPGPAPFSPPAMPQPPAAPTLRGWEPSGRAWDLAGAAETCSQGTERLAWPGHAPLNIHPTEGPRMAALQASGQMPGDLESFLGLGFDQLNTLMEGVTASDGAAIRTSIALKAGQTLVFDVLFAAYEPTTSNDFAAITVSRGGAGAGFVLSSIAATGDFGATPWQSVRYTAGAAGTYSVGFVVVNDRSPDGPSWLYVDAMRGALQTPDLHLVAGRTDAFGGRFELYSPEPEERLGEPRLIAGFEGALNPEERSGQAATCGGFVEADGCRGVYTPTEGASMAVLHARGEMRPKLEAFLGLEKAEGAVSALPVDADGTICGFGAATRLKVAVAEGDRISFDWMFDAADALPDNDLAVFTVAGGGGSQVFKLADVRATGDEGATGWRTSVYTAAGAGEVTIGFAVVNDRTSGGDTGDSWLLVDNVWLNRETAGGYQLADLAEPGDLATLPAA